MTPLQMFRERLLPTSPLPKFQANITQKQSYMASKEKKLRLWCDYHPFFAFMMSH